MSHSEIISVGNPVLFIKDNKIVGKGQAVTSHDGVCGIQAIDDTAKEFFKDDPVVKLLDWRFAFFHYSTYTGEPALGFNDEPEDRHLGTRVVDEFNLRWGLVPDSFKDVEGYRSGPTPHHESDT